MSSTEPPVLSAAPPLSPLDAPGISGNAGADIPPPVPSKAAGPIASNGSIGIGGVDGANSGTGTTKLNANADARAETTSISPTTSDSYGSMTRDDLQARRDTELWRQGDPSRKSGDFDRSLNDSLIPRDLESSHHRSSFSIAIGDAFDNIGSSVDEGPRRDPPPTALKADNTPGKKSTLGVKTLPVPPRSPGKGYGTSPPSKFALLGASPNKRPPSLSDKLMPDINMASLDGDTTVFFIDDNTIFPDEDAAPIPVLKDSAAAQFDTPLSHDSDADGVHDVHNSAVPVPREMFRGSFSAVGHNGTSLGGYQPADALRQHSTLAAQVEPPSRSSSSSSITEDLTSPETPSGPRIAAADAPPTATSLAASADAATGQPPVPEEPAGRKANGHHMTSLGAVGGASALAALAALKTAPDTKMGGEKADWNASITAIHGGSEGKQPADRTSMEIRKSLETAQQETTASERELPSTFEPPLTSPGIDSVPQTPMSPAGGLDPYSTLHAMDRAGSTTSITAIRHGAEGGHASPSTPAAAKTPGLSPLSNEAMPASGPLRDNRLASSGGPDPNNTRHAMDRAGSTTSITAIRHGAEGGHPSLPTPAAAKAPGPSPLSNEAMLASNPLRDNRLASIGGPDPNNTRHAMDRAASSTSITAIRHGAEGGHASLSTPPTAEPSNEAMLASSFLRDNVDDTAATPGSPVHAEVLQSPEPPVGPAGNDLTRVQPDEVAVPEHDHDDLNGAVAKETEYTVQPPAREYTVQPPAREHQPVALAQQTDVQEPTAAVPPEPEALRQVEPEGRVSPEMVKERGTHDTAPSVSGSDTFDTHGTTEESPTAMTPAVATGALAVVTATAASTRHDTTPPDSADKPLSPGTTPKSKRKRVPVPKLDLADEAALQSLSPGGPENSVGHPSHRGVEGCSRLPGTYPTPRWDGPSVARHDLRAGDMDDGAHLALSRSRSRSISPGRSTPVTARSSEFATAEDELRTSSEPHPMKETETQTPYPVNETETPYAVRETEAPHLVKETETPRPVTETQTPRPMTETETVGATTVRATENPLPSPPKQKLEPLQTDGAQGEMEMISSSPPATPNEAGGPRRRHSTSSRRSAGGLVSSIFMRGGTESPRPKTEVVDSDEPWRPEPGYQGVSGQGIENRPIRSRSRSGSIMGAARAAVTSAGSAITSGVRSVSSPSSSRIVTSPTSPPSPVSPTVSADKGRENNKTHQRNVSATSSSNTSRRRLGLLTKLKAEMRALSAKMGKT